MKLILTQALFLLIAVSAAAVGWRETGEHSFAPPEAAAETEEAFLPLPAWELRTEVDPSRAIVVVLQEMERDR